MDLYNVSEKYTAYIFKDLRMEAVISSEMLVSSYKSTCCKTIVDVFSAVTTSNLIS
jgi:hypothetical protein